MKTIADILEKARQRAKEMDLPYKGALLPVEAYQLLMEVTGAQLVDVRSQAELDCLKEAFRISECAVRAVLEKIRPGMTELQVVGIAQQALYENGAEYEAHALYLFCGSSTNNAISRPRYNLIEKGKIIQLNLGGRVDGYSPSIGIPCHPKWCRRTQQCAYCC